MHPIHRHLILCAAALWAVTLSFGADTPRTETAAWEILEGCRLAEAGVVSADRLRVRHDDEEYLFRLYFVDAPESSGGPPDQLADQARYFSLPETRIARAGESAAAFTRNFLGSGFTVVTRWKDARDGGERAWFAFLRRDGRHLAAELVREGHARIYGLPPGGGWPGGDPGSFLRRLKNLERASQGSKRGIWAAAGASPQVAGLDSLGAAEGGGAPDSPDAPAGRGIDLNSASPAELETLPGIGPALARRIIAARPFENVDALLAVSGIGPSTLAGFRDQVTVAGGDPPRGTAAYYLAEAEKYADTEVSVRVASVALPPGGSEAPAPESFRAVRLETRAEGRSGGSIRAFVPEEYFASFIDFHSRPGREFTGLFHRHEGEWVLIHRRKTHP